MYMDEGKGPHCRVVMIVLLWSRRCGLSHRGVVVVPLWCHCRIVDMLWLLHRHVVTLLLFMVMVVVVVSCR